MTRDVLDVARGELGNTEHPAGSNRTRYGKWMGLDGQPWCMSFVQWCFDQAGQPLLCRTGSCSALLNWYRKNRPACIVDQPRPGDIIIYSFGHTGMVESAAAGTVTAIEGNTSAGDGGSQDNGGGVFRRTRSRSLVKAYIRPFGEETGSGKLTDDGEGSNPGKGTDDGEETTIKEENMTGEAIYRALQDYLGRQPVPAWAERELAEAIQLGITDGGEPMQLIPRYQAAILAKRAAERR